MSKKLAVGLLFQEETIQNIREKINNSRYDALWKSIKGTADCVVEANNLIIPGDTFTIWYYVRNRLMDLALCALITEEEKYCSTLNHIMKELCLQGIDFWQGPHYPNRPRTIHYHGEDILAGELETAQQVMGISIAYDWGYAYLEEEVKTLVIQALRDKGQVLIRNSTRFQSEKWVMNHLCVLSAGLTLSSFILRSEGIDCEEDIALARRGMNLWMDKIDYDGSYGESYHYWAYPTNCLFFGLYAFKQVEKIELENTHKIAKAFEWAINNQVGKHEIEGYDRPVSVAVNLYDCPYLFQMEAPEALLYEKLLKNPLASWYINNFLIDNPPRPDCLHSVWHVNNSILLALDDSSTIAISPQDYGMPLDYYFADTGFVYMRDSWQNCGKNGGDVVFTLQSGGGGKSCSHEHYDKNSYTLYANGEYFISDPGHSCYRGKSHHEYDTSTKAHNTLSIDKKDQSLAFLERGMLHDEAKDYRSFHNQAHIVGRNFNSNISYIASEARRCYEPYLKQFTRRVWFVRPDFFVIWDRIDIGDVIGVPYNGFNLNNYDGKTKYWIHNNQINIERPKSDMTIDYVFPQNLEFELEPAKLHMAYHILQDQQVEGKWGSALRLTPMVEGGPAPYMDYLYVVCPKNKGEKPAEIKINKLVKDKEHANVIQELEMTISFRGRTEQFVINGEEVIYEGSQGEYYIF